MRNSNLVNFLGFDTITSFSVNWFPNDIFKLTSLLKWYEFERLIMSYVIGFTTLESWTFFSQIVNYRRDHCCVEQWKKYPAAIFFPKKKTPCVYRLQTALQLTKPNKASTFEESNLRFLLLSQLFYVRITPLRSFVFFRFLGNKLFFFLSRHVSYVFEICSMHVANNLLRWYVEIAQLSFCSVGTKQFIDYYI